MLAEHILGQIHIEGVPSVQRSAVGVVSGMGMNRGFYKATASVRDLSVISRMSVAPRCSRT
jgi:hypothetical protein